MQRTWTCHKLGKARRINDYVKHCDTSGSYWWCLSSWGWLAEASTMWVGCDASWQARWWLVSPKTGERERERDGKKGKVKMNAVKSVLPLLAQICRWWWWATKQALSTNENVLEKEKAFSNRPKWKQDELLLKEAGMGGKQKALRKNEKWKQFAKASSACL